ncbi:MAG: chemotaxis protein CheZ [Alphaproteobacteria bacterium]|jgi:chemotaxis protein CheZ
MLSNTTDSALAAELTGLQLLKLRRADAHEILEIVNSIIESMNRDIPSIDVTIRGDLQELSDFIKTTKEEILDLCPDEISQEHLPAASFELDAIVTATENATNSIMEAAELIEAVGADIGGEANDKLVEATTNIFEACSFQDITGQRIGKVVRALREIEIKIEDLLGVFGEADEERQVERLSRTRPLSADQSSGEHRQDAVSDSDLLEGPQLPENAISQDDIDALFSTG